MSIIDKDLSSENLCKMTKGKCDQITEMFTKSGYNKGVKQKNKKEIIKMKYVCDVCGYEYDEAVGDPDNGIAAGTKWEDLPEDFECPLCGVGKDQFSQAE